MQGCPTLHCRTSVQEMPQNVQQDKPCNHSLTQEILDVSLAFLIQIVFRKCVNSIY